MNAIRLKNFRSFLDTGTIELKPIVLLVGANSSGKSSLLRFFPLLKQTTELQSASPLLLNGRYVDFGDFEETVCRSSRGELIEIIFSFPTIHVHRIDEIVYVSRISATITPEISVKLQYVNSRTSVAAFRITIGENNCDIEIGNHSIVNSCIVNGIDLIKEIGTGSIPRCTASNTVPTFDESVFLRSKFIRILNTKAAEYIRDIVHKNTSERTILTHAARLTPGGADRILEQLKKIAFEPKAKRLYPNSAIVNKIRALTFARIVPMVMNESFRWLSQFGLATRYIGPFRLDPQRYYRNQELSVNQIEPHGENLAMFLRSLSDSERQRFSEWVSQIFEFHVTINPSRSHTEVRVKEKDQSYNIIDMGYGLSQVLPIIAQCWSSINTTPKHTSSERPRSSTLVAIEQPELHLHPRLQAKLADMFVSMIKETKKTANLIIETHSEAMINRFGEMISEGTLDRTDVLVLLFEKNTETSVTNVRKSQFDKDGVLSDWPIGFFSA